MKKKLMLSCLVIFTLLFASCDLSSTTTQMTIVNDGEETIQSIYVSTYLDVNSKASTSRIDSLDYGQEVAPGESVEYELPSINSDSYICVTIKTDTEEIFKLISITKDAVFTLHVVSDEDKYTIDGSGATLKNDVAG